MIELFYSNISMWGPTAESFVSRLDSQIVLLAEHHLDPAQFAKVRPRIISWKRSHFVSYAERKGVHAAATSGGQIIMPKSYLACDPVDPQLLAFCIPRLS